MASHCHIGMAQIVSDQLSPDLESSPSMTRIPQPTPCVTRLQQGLHSRAERSHPIDFPSLTRHRCPAKKAMIARPPSAPRKEQPTGGRDSGMALWDVSHLKRDVLLVYQHSESRVSFTFTFNFTSSHPTSTPFPLFREGNHTPSGSNVCLTAVA